MYLDEPTKARLQSYAEQIDLTDGGTARLLILEGLDRRSVPVPTDVEREQVPA